MRARWLSRLLLILIRVLVASACARVSSPSGPLVANAVAAPATTPTTGANTSSSASPAQPCGDLGGTCKVALGDKDPVCPAGWTRVEQVTVDAPDGGLVRVPACVGQRLGEELCCVPVYH
jgi:hypothetical protein